MFIVMTVTFATYVCTTILMLFLRDPTLTTLDTQQYSVFEAPFPSVAVCSYNKFSRSAIRKYAWNISQRSRGNETLDYWLHRLKMLSGIYNYDSLDFDDANKLQYELESIFKEPLKTSKVITMLSPKCEDLIVQCFWAGEIINCREQFELKIFIDGPCCVFNYQYMKNLELLLFPNATGYEMGLALVLNSSTDDYFYAEDSAIGFNFKLFSTQRIPDTSAGDGEEFHVGAGQDVSIQLNLVSQVTSEDARAYSVHKRGCYFPYEHQKAFYKSECLLACKILLIDSKCECLPFYALVADEDKEECSLRNLECFDYYKYELLDSLKCSDCYPLCSYNHYYFRKTTNGLQRTFKGHSNKIFFANISDIAQDLSLVKIYYPAGSGTRYYKNVLYNWYHILSNIGGVISICMGCSLVNGIEIIYFGGFRLLEKFIRLKNTQ